MIEPGIHLDMSDADYHADPCPAPSLSSSVAKVLLDASPAHAKAIHPRLTPGAASADTDRLALGSVVHALVLGRGSEYEVLDFDEYRTKDAKAARDAAIDAGSTPIKAKDYREAESIADACRAAISREPAIAADFANGDPEAVLIWREGDAWCRAMVDKLYIGDSHAVIYDLKTTDQSAHPAKVARGLVNLGYDMRAAFYMRGLARLMPHLAGRIRFRWVFVETAPPYAVTICELDGTGTVMGEKKAATAVALWQRCMAADDWPTWPAGVHRLDYPAWAETAWLARETDDPMLADLRVTTPAPESPPRTLEFHP